MKLADFCSKGWSDHAADAAAVYARLPEGIPLVESPQDAGMLTGLVVHVAGEHMGRWADGVALLDRIEATGHVPPGSPVAKAMMRSRAVLHRCAGDRDAEAKAFAAGRSGGDIPEASDRIRVLAIAAAALITQKRMAEARADFEECVKLAAYGPDKADPAARALAVTANNIAVEFENRPTLDDDERSLMLRAAAVARRFWQVAGGWMETERAEYRLALSNVKAGNAAGALRHAEECLRIVEANGSDAGEAFFAHEAIARAKLAGGDRAAARTARDRMAAVLPTIADESFRSFAAGELPKLDADLGPA